MRFVSPAVAAVQESVRRCRTSVTESSLLVFDKHVGPKQIILTANSEVIYAFSIFDLAKTGPLVAEVPEGMPGGIWDMWERGIEDIGLGRSAHGGKFMILRPDSKEQVPAGFIPVRPRTNVVLFAARGILKPGDSTEPFVKLASSIKLYTLKDKSRPTKIVLNGGKPFDRTGRKIRATSLGETHLEVRYLRWYQTQVDLYGEVAEQGLRRRIANPV